jgi:hypothetical protein
LSFVSSGASKKLLSEGSAIFDRLFDHLKILRQCRWIADIDAITCGVALETWRRLLKS